MKKIMDKEIKIPDQTACRLCRYNLTDVCEACWADGQFPWFKSRENLMLEDLPPFPMMEFNNGMPVKMRQIVVGLYMEVLVRALQGRE